MECKKNLLKDTLWKVLQYDFERVQIKLKGQI